MSLPVRSLPILQQWDCHHCGDCCRAPISVPLEPDDLARLREQGWEKQPDFQGEKIVLTTGLLRKEHWLNQRADGRCVFLQNDGLCRIHRELGEAAKPTACRVFPFQLTPMGDHVRLSARLHCPSAAANKGQDIARHIGEIRRWADQVLPSDRVVPPPEIVAGCRREWRETRRVTDALERIVLDRKLPLVRRLAHGLRFCDLFAKSKLARLDSKKFADLVHIAEATAGEEVAGLFRDRPAPTPAGAVLFRQTAAEYLRSHASLAQRSSLGTRWRLFRAAIQFARGKGEVPRIHSSLPVATFDDLEQPLGSLSPDLLKPLETFFETTTAALQYCGATHGGWPVVEGFRSLALAFPVSLWTLRWMARGKQLEAADAIELAGILDRSHHYPLLLGYRHRRRVATLAFTGDLERLIVWYAR